MRKALSLVLAFFLVLMLVSCDPNSANSNSATGSSVHRSAIESIGDVSRIFSANQSRSTATVYEVSTSRFYTGQELTMYGHEVVFEADIVEYNSIDQAILDYVESLESCNALMHQNYPLFNSGEINPEKKYVEFASYIDKETNEAICHEIRVFFGNFMDTYNSGSYYAKAVTFSPDMTVDINNHVNVYTGEHDNYQVQQGNIPVTPYQPRHLEMRDVTASKASQFAYLGEVNRVFAWYEGEEFDYIHMFGGDDTLAECYLVELNSMSDNATTAFAGVANNNGLHQREWTIVSLDGKSYIEVCHYTTASTGRSWNSYRIRTDHMEGTTYGYYTKCVQNI